MKKILWISRHQMTQEQQGDLQRIAGPFQMLQYSNTVKDIRQLSEEIQWADVICAVLPPELYHDLLEAASGRPVLRAVSGRVPAGTCRTLSDGRTEAEFTFVHKGWEQILKMEIVTRLL